MQTVSFFLVASSQHGGAEHTLRAEQASTEGRSAKKSVVSSLLEDGIRKARHLARDWDGLVGLGVVRAEGLEKVGHLICLLELVGFLIVGKVVPGASRHAEEALTGRVGRLADELLVAVSDVAHDDLKGVGQHSWDRLLAALALAVHDVSAARRIRADLVLEADEVIWRDVVNDTRHVGPLGVLVHLHRLVVDLLLKLLDGNAALREDQGLARRLAVLLLLDAVDASAAEGLQLWRGGISIVVDLVLVEEGLELLGGRELFLRGGVRRTQSDIGAGVMSGKVEKKWWAPRRATMLAPRGCVTL